MLQCPTTCRYQSDFCQARSHDFSGIFSRPGEYQDEKGALQCKMCPPGTTTIILGMKSISGQVWAMISVDFPMSLSSGHCVSALLTVSAISRKILSQVEVCSESMGHLPSTRFWLPCRVSMDPRSARHACRAFQKLKDRITPHLKPCLSGMPDCETRRMKRCMMVGV